MTSQIPTFEQEMFSQWLKTLERYRTMSWADIHFEIEEEEEREEQRRIQALQEERKKLYALGLYELEDGEILE